MIVKSRTQDLSPRACFDELPFSDNHTYESQILYLNNLYLFSLPLSLPLPIDSKSLPIFIFFFFLSLQNNKNKNKSRRKKEKKKEKRENFDLKEHRKVLHFMKNERIKKKRKKRWEKRSKKRERSFMIKKYSFLSFFIFLLLLLGVTVSKHYECFISKHPKQKRGKVNGFVERANWFVAVVVAVSYCFHFPFTFLPSLPSFVHFCLIDNIQSHFQLYSLPFVSLFWPVSNLE